MLGTGYALPAVLLLRSDRCRCRGAGVRCMAEVHSNNRRACKNENYCPFGEDRMADGTDEIK